MDKSKPILSAKTRGKEKGLRTILNFGHTVGHAIETAAKFVSYNHGEAVAIGMVVAGDISVSLGLTDKMTYSRIEKTITKIGLPIKIDKIKLGAIINAHYADKKFIGKRNRFVLITGIRQGESC